MPSSAAKRALTYLLAGLAGVAGALLGWLVTGLIADAILGAFGMSAINGGRAMVAFFTVAPFGGIAGLILGIWLVLRFQGAYRGFGNIVGRAALVAAGIVALAAASLGAYVLSDDQLAHNSLPPQAMFELRFPAGSTLPVNLEGLKIDLDTDKNSMPAIWDNEVNDDGGRPIVRGAVDLDFRTTHRQLVLRVPNEPARLFTLKLAGNPSATAEFGPWQRVDFIEEPGADTPRKAGPGDDYEIRYRVRRPD
jgi:hypothetical protein